jgi:hypothetical protein
MFKIHFRDRRSDFEFENILPVAWLTSLRKIRIPLQNPQIKHTTLHIVFSRVVQNVNDWFYA